MIDHSRPALRLLAIIVVPTVAIIALMLALKSQPIDAYAAPTLHEASQIGHPSTQSNCI